MYSTVTPEGQITLPAAWRQRAGLQPGQKLAMRQTDDAIIIDLPHPLSALRQQARAEMEAAGTWGVTVKPDDGWASAAAEKLGR